MHRVQRITPVRCILQPFTNIDSCLTSGGRVPKRLGIEAAIEQFRSKILELQNIETLARSVGVINEPLPRLR